MQAMADSTPICRCRVLYLGSSVPRQSKDGLQGIQEPLRSLYPAEGAIGAKGIDSWLSVWSNGILLENVDENLKQITRFFPIESLHYCAAVRQVLIPERGNSNPEPKFLPLDSPFARMPRVQHPPIFAAILRRTTGIKVLECHVFICKREAAANALVRCCFHAYADNSYARQLETGSISNGTTSSSVYGTLRKDVAYRSNVDLYAEEVSMNQSHRNQLRNNDWRSRAGSITAQSSFENLGNKPISADLSLDGPSSKNFYGSNVDIDIDVEDGDASIYNGNENHKIWNGSQDQLNGVATESPYEMFSNHTSTIGRHTRVRQITVPVKVPPPPLKDEGKRSNEKSTKKSNKTVGSQSLSGTLMRPKPNHSTNKMQQNINSLSGRLAPLTPRNGARQYHTISCRSVPHSSLGVPITGPQPQPYFEAANMHPYTPFIQNSQVHMGYPMHMPVMMPQRYATLQHPSMPKNKKKDQKKNKVAVGIPTVPPIYSYQQQSVNIPTQQLPDPRSLAMTNRRHAASVGNGLDESGNSGTESPINTGIYKRKGHLNERAFSYSIRQEHRSRSHGSLASIQFNPPDMKKEREIAQMVAGLDLDDNDYHSGSRAVIKQQLDTNEDLHNPNQYIYDKKRMEYRNFMIDSLSNAKIK